MADLSSLDLNEACRYLSACDKGLAKIIADVGPCGLQVRSNRSVFEYLCRAFGICVRFDDFVKGALHVEHHRVERAVACVLRDLPWGVVQFGQPHRLRESASWVDGQDAHVSAALRRS